MKRREFIILTGIGATSTGVLTACGHPENKLVAALVPDDEYVPGIDYWKASTCHMCEAGCGITVRTREHKANKIEGNPHHPVNRGALCARGQAGLQALYHPDRIRSPLRRAGERGSGQFEEITWDEAIKTLADRLREIKRLKPAEVDSVVFLSGHQHTVSRLAAEHLMSAYGSGSLVSAQPDPEAWAISSYAASYGRPGLPIFDIANATYLLSFGARFLETWHSPVRYSLAYGEFRHTPGRARGRFVQVEPRMSLTAANADEWLPAAAGTEGLVALAMMQVMTREGLIKGAAPPDLSALPLDEYAPEKTAGQTDIPAEKVIRIAREFAASERPLAIAGGLAASLTYGVERMKAINQLNMLAGNLNKPGGVFLPEADYLAPIQPLRPTGKIPQRLDYETRVTSGKVDALLVHNANPAYTAPSILGSLKAVPFIASFSSFMDETTQLADLVLPDHSHLESWDIKAAQASGTEAAYSITRPVVALEHNTRQTADVLIALARELGHQMPFGSAEEAVKRVATSLREAGGSITAESDDAFWEAFLERGVWVGRPKGERKQEASFHAGQVIGEMADEPIYQQERVSDQSEFPFVLLAYEHAALGFGEQAHLSWLQELPDPMTSVVWGSWVEINPKTAASLGINDGDLVEVETPYGAARAPAAVYPAIRPDVVAMPFGQGHTAFGGYAINRGANVAAPDPFAIRSGLTSVTVRARVTRVGRGRLTRFGTNLPERIESER